MKQKDVADLHHKSVAELKKQLRDLRHEIAEIQLDLVTGKEKNTAKRKNLGKDLARVLTVLGTKEQNMVESAVTSQSEVVDVKKESNENKEKGESVKGKVKS